MSRNDTFPNKFQALLKDVENVSGEMNWQVKTYLSQDQVFAFNDPALFNFLILSPEDYVPRDEFKVKDMKENISQFFKSSMVNDLTLDGNVVTLSHRGGRIILEVVDVGDYDTVIGRNFLAESAFIMEDAPQEAKMLKFLTGFDVLPIGGYFCIQGDEKIMLVKNAQIEYGAR